MSRKSRMTRARADALGTLMRRLLACVGSGERVPCVVPDRGHWWLSDDPDVVEAACAACGSCPALDDCRAYIARFPETAGVWAGSSASERAAAC